MLLKPSEPCYRGICKPIFHHNLGFFVFFFFCSVWPTVLLWVWQGPCTNLWHSLGLGGSLHVFLYSGRWAVGLYRFSSCSLTHTHYLGLCFSIHCPTGGGEKGLYRQGLWSQPGLEVLSSKDQSRNRGLQSCPCQSLVGAYGEGLPRSVSPHRTHVLFCVLELY